MSLMSKVMAPLLAKGFWNAGLLATEAGSIGRLVGNLALMGLGNVFALESLHGVTMFGNWLYGFFFVTSVGGLVYTLLLYLGLKA